MPLDQGFVIPQLAAEQYKLGPIPNHPLKAILDVIVQNNPSARAMGDGIQRVVITNANGTAQVVKASAGIVYHVRAENTDNDAIIVQILDGTIVKASFLVEGATAVVPFTTRVGELSIFGDLAVSPGAGQQHTTSITVKAVKASDGTTPADAGNVIKVVYK